MKWIIGLGNPGNEYEQTRHNVGFVVLDEMVRKFKGRWEAGKGDFLFVRLRYRQEEIELVKPLTYMNNSGLAVADIVDRYEAPTESILVVCDDFNIPLGQLRLRPGGADGGHNGLYSIIYQLRTEMFPRLRCGIATDRTPRNKEMMAAYVLSAFEPEELPAVKAMVPRASEAALCFSVEGIERAMNRYNQSSTS